MWWTLMGACIASVTALIVAFFVYPWQKRKDRELQLHAEGRTVYARLMVVYNRWLVAILEGDLEKTFLAQADFVADLMVVQLYAPDDVLAALRVLIDNTKALRKHTFEMTLQGSDPEVWQHERDGIWQSVTEARLDFIIVCRADLFSTSRAEASATVGTFMPDSLRDEIAPPPRS